MVNDESGEIRGRFFSRSPEATRELGRALGASCAGGEILLLNGDLGSGKTCFAQGLALGLGIPAEMRIASPTFTIHAEYAGRLYLNHLDLYRLETPFQLDGLGIEDMLADPGAVTAVEWPDLMTPLLRGERLEIALADIGDSSREFAATAFGPRHRELLSRWIAAAPSAAFNGDAEFPAENQTR